MKAYVVVNVDVTDPEQYKEYVQLASLAGTKYNAKYLVRGGAVEVLEGVEPKRVALLEFPSMQAARDWYHSPEYTLARNTRINAAKMNMFIVEGIAI